MKNYLISIIFIGLLFFASCTSTKVIQKNMNSDSYSLSYLKDSKISKEKLDFNVSIDSVVFESLMNDTTKVHKLKGWFIPLVLVNLWNSQNECIQGKSMFEEDIPDFLQASLIEEINRSGNFNYDSLNNSDYQLEISIDEIRTQGPYESKGFFYFAFFVYGYSYADVAGPATSNLAVTYKLKKGDSVLQSNSFYSEKITEQINKRYTNTKILQQDYAISMVEAVSYNFKNVIELIIADLNDYFDKEK
ncbi:MAG: hypothetical protein R2757_10985 [Draconibacterium sp.]